MMKSLIVAAAGAATIFAVSVTASGLPSATPLTSDPFCSFEYFDGPIATIVLLRRQQSSRDLSPSLFALSSSDEAKWTASSIYDVK